MSSNQLRIEFLTQEDPLYILPFFEEFFANYRQQFAITGVSSCPVMGGRSRLQMVRELMQLYGVLGFTKLAVERVFKTATGRSLNGLCKKHGLDFREVENPNREEYISRVKANKADVIVSVACPFILKEKVLAATRLGCVNIHHAPLPRYKGMMPSFWQLFHGEKSVGVTVHTMGAKVDEGAILLQESMEVEAGETLDHLIRRSKRHGAHCMAKALTMLQEGSVNPIFPQDPGTYFTFPTASEIADFKKRGLRAI